MTGVIYKLIFPNKKLYIGQTIQNPDVRFRRHINDSFNQNKPNYNSKICRAIRKYGKNRVAVYKKIEFEIIITANKKDLDGLEMHYIEQLDTFKCGYNSDKGGKGIKGYRQTKKAKRKISDRSKLMTGENATNNKTNQKDINEMRKMYLAGVKITEIHGRFSYLAYSTVAGIVKNKTWKDDIYENELAVINKNRMNLDRANSIRREYIGGRKIVELSEQYGLCNSQIHNILKNKRWVGNVDLERMNRIAQENEISGAKLNREQVVRIREYYVAGKTVGEIKKMFNISRETVYNIISNRTWKKVK